MGELMTSSLSDATAGALLMQPREAPTSDDPEPREIIAPAVRNEPVSRRAGAAPPRRAATAAAAGPGITVRARTAIRRENVAALAGAQAESGAARVRALWEAGRDESRAFARRLRMVAEFAHDLSADDPARDPDEDDIDIMAVAVALRMSTDQAEAIIRDGHAAVHGLPRTLDLLSSGEMPASWFARLLRSIRSLPASACALVDERVSTWDLASIPVARFRRELRLLVAWVSARVDPTDAPAPASLRGVDLADVDPCAGTARLEITGPIPEILSLAHRLDESARAVQRAQRHALEQGAEAPFDVGGTVTERAQPLSLRALRYALLTRTVLETDGVEVPASRFRLNVTVPVLTLLGASDAPGAVEGEHPIPAAMARALAADEPVWHRILTDPATGVHLPAAADAYRPSAQMREHLRLRHPVCAAPGCLRSTTRAAEVDHIEEFDHADPSAGGRTELTNLHLLCWRHHQLKTARRIDPIRGPGASAPPGSAPPRSAPPAHTTHWHLAHGLEVRLEDARDLFTPDQVAMLEAAWAEHQQLDQLRYERAAFADDDRTDTDAENDECGGGTEAAEGSQRYSTPPPF